MNHSKVSQPPFVRLSKYSNESTRGRKAKFLAQNGPVVEHFLIVNQGLDGILPRLVGKW